MIPYNLLHYIHGLPLAAAYSSYSCCPLIIGSGKTFMAEFNYKQESGSYWNRMLAGAQHERRIYREEKAERYQAPGHGLDHPWALRGCLHEERSPVNSWQSTVCIAGGRFRPGRGMNGRHHQGARLHQSCGLVIGKHDEVLLIGACNPHRFPPWENYLIDFTWAL
ncbi:MAG: hypothetical protein K9J75_14315 [Cyanobium usitatum Tobar12.5m-G36]|nr:hypothetical protein [Cyanobium usitatum Tobar12.5m-G36]